MLKKKFYEIIKRAYNLGKNQAMMPSLKVLIILL